MVKPAQDLLLALSFLLSRSTYSIIGAMSGKPVKEEPAFVQFEQNDPYMVGYVREAMDSAAPGETM